MKLRRAPTRYLPIELIASGGMAEVWRAEAVFEIGGRHMVAIKRVLPELASNAMYRSMFEDEARLGMKLRHKNLVRVYDAREVAGTYIMIMELVDGTSLKDLLDAAMRRRACMPVPTALHMVRELAAALDYAHHATDPQGHPLGIIHRDVSPHNVLLGKNGDVKLVDFGLADANVHQTMRGADKVGGKLGYLAPEVVLNKPTDHRVDIFATGIVLWEALTGRQLFRGEDDVETIRNVVRLPVPPASSYAEAVPPELDALLARALDRNPDRRVPTTQILMTEVDRLLLALDSEVGPKDVSLLVGLHLAATRRRAEPALSGPELLAQELDAFVLAAQGVDYDVGTQPLDPLAFSARPPAPGPATGGTSGVRPMPADGDGDGIDSEFDGWFRK